MHINIVVISLYKPGFWFFRILKALHRFLTFQVSFQDEFYGNKHGDEYYANMSDVEISDDDGTLSRTRICH
ncbi:hypothetical protein T06_1749 [Trichinella sp. T6]|nr:hypothetical protein T06_1749 [Trichinella sp. T6]